MRAKSLLNTVQTHLFLSCLLFSLLANQGVSQTNLITVNPDFITDINNWSANGAGVLSHDTAGAITPGSMSLYVPVSGSHSSSQIKSKSIAIPDSLRGKLLSISFYCKSPEDNEFKLRLWTKDTTNTVNNIFNQTYSNDTNYIRRTLPFQTSGSDSIILFYLQCGAYVGTYNFDDLTIDYCEVDLKNINQFDHWEPRVLNIPDSVASQTLSTGTSSNQFSLNIYDTLAPVMRTQFGVNANFRSGPSMVGRAPLYEEFGAFRFPAGIGSDQYFWDCSYPSLLINLSGGSICGTAGNRCSPSQFVTFKQNAQGEATVVVNYGYARYGYTPSGTREDRVAQAASYAAGFVRYLNVDLNADIKYWEVGNENYNSTEPGSNVNGSILSGQEYGEDFRVFADSMKAVDPTIRIGAVLSHNKFGWNGEVLKEVQDHADFLIFHHYITNINSAYYSKRGVRTITRDIEEMQLIAKNVTNKPLGHFPVAMTEYNAQGEQTTTISNGLYFADLLGSFVKNRVTLATSWVNEWGLDGTNNYNSHGLLARNDPNQANYTARPVFTPYYYYGKCFGDQMVSSSITGTGVDEISGYASTFSDGNIGISLINYADSSQTISLQYQDLSDKDTLYWYTVHADNKNFGNMKFYINGLTSSTPGGGPDLENVPANMATINDSAFLTLPKFSMTFISIKKADIHPPTMGTLNDTIVTTDFNDCFANNITLGAPSASDNIGVTSIINDAPTSFPIGSTTVTWTASDAAGNTTTTTQIVTVIDTESPTIIAPADVTISADVGSCHATGVVLGSETASDNCTFTVSNDAPTTFPIGTTTVTYTVTDAAGNTATSTQIVTTTDTESPVILAPADVTVDTDAGLCYATGVMLGSETASDNCSFTVSNDAPTTFPIGTTTVTYTATDAAGNTATSTQIVTVTDTESPTITAPADITVNANATGCTAANVMLGTETSSDNCTFMVSNDAPTVFPMGTTTVTWTATDDAGNTATDIQTVMVISDLALSAITTDEMSGNDGSIDLMVSGGNASYQYSWSSGESTEDLTGLEAGTYTVIVTDSIGCSDTLEVIIDSQVGLVEAHLKEPRIYPNPTDGVLTLDMPEVEGIVVVQVIDIHGKVVYEESTTSNGTPLQLNLESIATGNYLLQINSDNLKHTLQFVKE